MPTEPVHLSLLDVNLHRHAAGRSVGPVAPKMKGPSLVQQRDSVKRTQGESFNIRWKHTYAITRAATSEIRRWFAGPQLMGCGIFCGPVSGTTIHGVVYSVEVTECDDAETLQKFETLMREWGFGALLAQLPKELTPRLGAHFPYLTPVVEGNQHLARRKIGEDEKGKDILQVLIETRGEGGFIVTSPTPPGIHPTVPQRGYEMERGSWEELPIISADARNQIFACARALNEYFEEEHTDRESETQRKARIGTYPVDTPLGDYQARATTEGMKTFWLMCNQCMLTSDQRTFVGPTGV
jgi:Bifunctional DNA primase/polymerase, N-terminal